MTRDARRRLTQSIALGAAHASLVNGRLTSREMLERATVAPIAGGDRAPPSGGLFDDDARGQSDLFDGRSS